MRSCSPRRGGCSASQRDSDGDGVKDNVDKCPNTPAGEKVDLYLEGADQHRAETEKDHVCLLGIAEQ